MRRASPSPAATGSFCASSPAILSSTSNLRGSFWKRWALVRSLLLKIEIGYRLPATSYRLIMAALVLLTCAACRQDMHDQPKYTAYKASDFFADGRSARPLVEGTVAQGHLN